MDKPTITASESLQGWAWSLDISPTEKLLLLALIRNAGADGVCSITYPTLAALINMSVATVGLLIRRLEKCRAIDVHPQSDELGSPLPTKYTFNAETDCRRRQGFIYVFHCNGLYKIGKSIHPEKRLYALQTVLGQQGLEVTLAHKFPCADSLKVEKALHRRFSERRRKGEWFELTPEDLNTLKAL